MTMKAVPKGTHLYYLSTYILDKWPKRESMGERITVKATPKGIN